MALLVAPETPAISRTPTRPIPNLQPFLVWNATMYTATQALFRIPHGWQNHTRDPFCPIDLNLCGRPFEAVFSWSPGEDDPMPGRCPLSATWLHVLWMVATGRTFGHRVSFSRDDLRRFLGVEDRHRSHEVLDRRLASDIRLLRNLSVVVDAGSPGRCRKERVWIVQTPPDGSLHVWPGPWADDLQTNVPDRPSGNLPMGLFDGMVREQSVWPLATALVLGFKSRLRVLQKPILSAYPREVVALTGWDLSNRRHHERTMIGMVEGCKSQANIGLTLNPKSLPKYVQDRCHLSAGVTSRLSRGFMDRFLDCQVRFEMTEDQWMKTRSEPFLGFWPDPNAS